MSPGFRTVLRYAGVPVDSSEPVRRKFGSRLIGIVTVCLLPLLIFDVPLWVFVLSQIVWGRGLHRPVRCRRQVPAPVISR